MNRSVLFFTLAVVCISIARESQAAIIHESASLGFTGISGAPSASLNGTYLGSRFSVNTVVQVESVGGHLLGIFGPATIFAAIVSLTSPTTLPSGDPFDATTLGSTLFSVPSPSEDLLFPFSVTLNPGHYALIFGVEPTSTNPGAMPTNNFDIPGRASYFRWNQLSGEWTNSAPTGLRFVVTGRVIPEPCSFALFCLGSLGACGIYRRFRNYTRH
jgi:hypothetical protein